MTSGAAVDLPARLADSLAARGATEFQVAFVLGSGLGEFVERLEDAREIPFEELEGMPRSTVPGHAGRFVLGRLGGASVLVQQGRVHLYEGRSSIEVTAAARAFARLGCRSLVLTNAAGGLDPALRLPALMRIEDHINMQGIAPLLCDEQARGNPYSPRLALALDEAATALDIAFTSGVYLGLPGPSYETPAEIAHFARLGVGAVGMSTVAEASAAHAAGLSVAGISCITNLAAGMNSRALSHDDVVEAAAKMSDDLGRLLAGATPALAGQGL